MSTLHALILDPDPVARAQLTEVLTDNGFETVAAQDTDRLDLLVARIRPDLVVLDVTTPGPWRWTGLRSLCSQNGVPVIVTSGRPHPEEAIACLDSGAVDYVAKPYHLGELAARLRRRVRPAQGGVAPARLLVVGAVTLDVQERRTTIRGVPVPLTTMEFDLLHCLAKSPGEVFSRSALLRLVWGHTVGDASTVTVHIRRLRAKIEADPAQPTLLRTRWGVGYWLSDHEEPDPVPVAELAAEPVGDLTAAGRDREPATEFARSA